MLEAVTSGITQVITWVGTVITALTGDSGALNALLPLFAIGISISAILLGESFNAQYKCSEFGRHLLKTIPSEAHIGNV